MGLQCGLGFAKSFLPENSFRKTETTLLLHFVRAEEGSGECPEGEQSSLRGKNAGGLLNFFDGGSSNYLLLQ